jgi:hypothetical protein
MRDLDRHATGQREVTFERDQALRGQVDGDK